jgi:PAS domain S-box-containing protein
VSDHDASMGARRPANLRARLLERSPVALFLVDSRGECLYCNDAFKDLTGWSPGTLPFTRWWTTHVPADDQRRVVPLIVAGRRSGQPYAIDYRFRRDDGSVRHVLSRTTPLVGDDGHVEAFGGAAVDITEFDERAAALERVSRNQTEFLALLAHELSNPLTSVLGYAQRLRAGELDEAQRREATDEIIAQAERLRGLIGGMQTLARGEPGEVAVEPLLLQRVAPRLAAPLALRLGRPVVCRLPDDLPPVLSQDGWLEQILENLLSNAAKYAPDGEIEVEASLDEGRVRVEVLDRGPGIDPQEAERIFEPFFRSPGNSATTHGAGLGLAVCKRLVELHGGNISARRRDGGGAVFAFTLPLAAESGRAEP